MSLDYRIMKFVHLLRVLGIRVSVAETLDAIEGLGYADIADKVQVKAILRATLLKNMDQLPLFEEAFSAYFAPPEIREQCHLEQQEQARIEAVQIAQAEQELNFQGMSLELTPEQKQLYNRLPEEGKQRIQTFLQRSSAGKRGGQQLDVHFKPIVENIVRGQLDYWKRVLGEELPLFEALPTGDTETDELVKSVAEELRDHRANYLYEDLKNIADKDLPRVNALIHRLSRRLATKISRRYHRSKRVSQVDLRRTIRSSLSYGGTLMELKYTAKRRNRPRLLLLCDVSGSMARYASFVLQFIYGLSSVLKGIDSFVFADCLERVTHDFSRETGFEQNMAELMNQSKEWGGGTNLARALEELAAIRPNLLTRDTVMIIVSDTKTLEAQRAASLLKTVRAKIRDVIWLNTLPKKQWAEQKCVGEFAKVGLMFECYTLAHLERIMASQFVR